MIIKEYPLDDFIEDHKGNGNAKIRVFAAWEKEVLHEGRHDFLPRSCRREDESVSGLGIHMQKALKEGEKAQRVAKFP